MITPRPYISFHQFNLILNKPAEYRRQYLNVPPIKPKMNQNMWFGKKLADALEAKEASGDPLLDFVTAQIPLLELRDKPFTTILKDKKEDITVLAKPDTATRSLSKIYEFKTSIRKWTQRMADESDQVTFYATAAWLKTGRIPQDIRLVAVMTEYDEKHRLKPTGDVLHIPTKRTMGDIIKMTSRIRLAWSKIQELCEVELT